MATSQAALYRLLKTEKETNETTEEILNKLNSLKSEITTAGTNNNVSNYTVEPVSVHLDETVEIREEVQMGPVDVYMYFNGELKQAYLLQESGTTNLTVSVAGDSVTEDKYLYYANGDAIKIGTNYYHLVDASYRVSATDAGYGKFTVTPNIYSYGGYNAEGQSIYSKTSEYRIVLSQKPTLDGYTRLYRNNSGDSSYYLQYNMFIRTNLVTTDVNDNTLPICDGISAMPILTNGPDTFDIIDVVPDTPSDEQRYVFKAKIHDFNYVGYLEYRRIIYFIRDDAIPGCILTNGKLYDANTMKLISMQLDKETGEFIALTDDVGVRFKTKEVAIPAEGKYALYIPSANDFGAMKADRELPFTVSPQITYVNDMTVYCAAPTPNDNSGEPVYVLVPITSLS